jgi:uncharacterized membrane protein (UPF0127 family)
VLGNRVRVAKTFLSRLVGLLGTPELPPGEGLWIVPASGVHTFGMPYPVDVAFLDARGGVVGLEPGLRPNRWSRFHTGARAVLEVRAGTLAVTGTVVGDRLEFDGGGLP